MKNRKQPQEPVIYKNQELMNEFNEMMIRIKVHLFQNFNKLYGDKHSMPTNEELDNITNKIMTALKEDNKPHIKY
jgi:hypothetical protein